MRFKKGFLGKFGEQFSLHLRLLPGISHSVINVLAAMPYQTGVPKTRGRVAGCGLRFSSVCRVNKNRQNFF